MLKQYFNISLLYYMLILKNKDWKLNLKMYKTSI